MGEITGTEGQSVITPKRKGFLFDPNKCTGCQACEIACALENSLDGMSWRQVVTLNEEHRPGVPVIHLSMACNHCADAPCAKACPALAYTKDPVTGRVNLDPDHCIGCKYCSWACPYDAPKFDEPRGVMTKCTFCGHRQDQGLGPACVELCPTGALGFGELATLPGEGAMPGVPTTVPRPSARFIPWRGPGNTSGPRDEPRPADPTPGAPSKITLASEWPLLAFTLLTAALVALFTASIFGSFQLPVFAFLVPAAAGMALSSLHLGRKERAWRAVLNFRRSWLSREVVLYSAFTGLATLSLLLPAHTILAPAAALLGFASLFAMDRVYDVVRPREWQRIHSADVLPTGLLLTAILSGHLPATAALASVKLVLYGTRKLGRRTDPRIGWSVVRIVAGFVVPVGMGLVDPERWTAWAAAGTLLGELVDRAEFYTELEVPSPRREMASELARRSAAMS